MKSSLILEEDGRGGVAVGPGNLGADGCLKVTGVVVGAEGDAVTREAGLSVDLSLEAGGRAGDA